MLVDAFMFYNELDVLEARLELLDDHVDLFVLVEAEVTHKGGPKPLFFEQNKQRFEQWLPKICHIVAKDMPTEKDPWAREKYQRNCVLQGLEGVPDEAIVMVSDVDEIPDMRVIRYEQLGTCMLAVHMHMFEYSLKHYFTVEPWYGTTITTKDLLVRWGPNYFRDNRWKLPLVHFGGWHLSSFGDWEHVYNKFQNYAHANDTATPKDPEVFRRSVEMGLWNGKSLQTPPPGSLPPLPERLLKKFL
jgi:beta-1,4-mannosyl-glycoprotein beta-1,4-N-acetylglucosaminyltransferase